jgi:hypothetical protein
MRMATPGTEHIKSNWLAPELDRFMKARVKLCLAESNVHDVRRD